MIIGHQHLQLSTYKDNIMNKIMWFLPLFLVFGSCQCQPPLPITINPIEITDTNKCLPACENLRRLGCPEGQPVFNGETCQAGMGCNLGTCIEAKCMATCERFCADMQDSGVWLNPTCVAEIQSCNVIEDCAINGNIQ
jgi:hypothetical protein